MDVAVVVVVGGYQDFHSPPKKKWLLRLCERLHHHLSLRRHGCGLSLVPNEIPFLYTPFTHSHRVHRQRKVRRWPTTTSHWCPSEREHTHAENMHAHMHTYNARAYNRTYGFGLSLLKKKSMTHVKQKSYHYKSQLSSWTNVKNKIQRESSFTICCMICKSRWCRWYVSIMTTCFQTPSIPGKRFLRKWQPSPVPRHKRWRVWCAWRTWKTLYFKDDVERRIFLDNISFCNSIFGKVRVIRTSILYITKRGRANMCVWER